uniref:F-box domain-containing protein n=1 Tax=Parastrongyloides trichosuri TaxID=131310 RepID=A0A0N4Z6P3_PARTI
MMNLESLPTEILNIIISYLDTKTQKELRSVSRYFYNLINYIPSDRRRSLSTIIVNDVASNNHTNGMNIVLRFFSLRKKKSRLDNDYYNHPYDFYVTVKNIHGLRFYLDRSYLDNIESAHISIEKRKEIFNILNRYFDRESSIEKLDISVKNCSVWNELYQFISTVSNINHIKITNLCLGHQEIRNNVLFPIKNTLKSFHINECQCTKVLNSRMMKSLISNNYDLKNITIYSDHEKYEEDIISAVKKRSLIKKEYDSYCYKFNVTFGSSHFNIMEEQEKCIKLFNDDLYIISEISKIDDNFCYIEAYKKSDHCYKDRIISIGLKKITLDEIPHCS